MDKMLDVRNTEFLVSSAIYSDRLARLIGWLHLSPLQTGIIAFAISSLSSLAISLVSGAMFSNQSFTSLVNDRLFLISFALYIPLVWGYYTWIITIPMQVLYVLQISQIMQLGERELDIQLEVYRNTNSLLIASLLGLLTSGFIYMRTISESPNRLNLNPTLYAIYNFLILAPTAIVAWSTFIRFIYNARFFNSLLRELPSVYPMHPDKAGGLGILGRYALTTSLPFAIGGCLSVLSGYSLYLQGKLATAYHVQAAFIICIIFVLLCYFGPLVAIHKKMLRIKETNIAIISGERSIEYELASRGFTGSSRTLIEQLEKLRNLNELGQMIDRQLPVWPISPNTNLRFLLALLSPFFVLAILISIEVLWKLQ